MQCKKKKNHDTAYKNITVTAISNLQGRICFFV
jgi:uncharacterized radical SAM superfamily Fe-S cluster-containing enzyme